MKSHLRIPRWMHQSASFALVFIFGGLLVGCAAKPTEEACRAAIQHMLEVQLDEMAVERAALLGQGSLKEQTDILKAGIPASIRPEVVAMCIDRMKPADLQCTLTATSSEELINKCHWKPVSGAKGAALGF